MTEAVVRTDAIVPRSLFPIEGEAVRSAFSLVNHPDLQTQRFILEQERLMVRENPYAVTFLKEFADGGIAQGDDLSTRDFINGAVFAYIVFKQKVNDAPIATISEDFIRDYGFKSASYDSGLVLSDEEELGNTEEFSKEAVIQMFEDDPEAMSRIKYDQMVRVNMFRLMEREFFDLMMRNVVATGEEINPFESAFYAGVISTYFLFQDAFSDPKNFYKKTDRDN